MSILRRDVPPDELAARDDIRDFIALLNTPQAKTARDSDDASNMRFLNALLNSRDVTPEQQIVARDDSDNVKLLHALLQSRDVPPEQQTVARDDPDDVNLLHALLQSRDITPEQQLVALTLASRSFDDFYDDLD